ncbi:hypothetical protein ILYODFUR_014545 [Ilyodon furcidens]|uniref:Uncharacterized protein n=1 Tax=Ilyodon furcidens TaxID=33524 RepID=A0ABV0UG68_9TELE
MDSSFWLYYYGNDMFSHEAESCSSSCVRPRPTNRCGSAGVQMSNGKHLIRVGIPLLHHPKSFEFLPHPLRFCSVESLIFLIYTLYPCFYQGYE